MTGLGVFGCFVGYRIFGSAVFDLGRGGGCMIRFRFAEEGEALRDSFIIH